MGDTWEAVLSAPGWETTQIIRDESGQIVGSRKPLPAPQAEAENWLRAGKVYGDLRAELAAETTAEAAQIQLDAQLPDMYRRAALVGAMAAIEKLDPKGRKHGRIEIRLQTGVLEVEY